MYIPITKTEEKCAGQLSYGFNIQDKLEGCIHEKKILLGFEFLELCTQQYRIFRREFLRKFLVFSENSFKRISFVKLTPFHFFEQNL